MTAEILEYPVVKQETLCILEVKMDKRTSKFLDMVETYTELEKFYLPSGRKSFLQSECEKMSFSIAFNKERRQFHLKCEVFLKSKIVRRHEEFLPVTREKIYSRDVQIFFRDM